MNAPIASDAMASARAKPVTRDDDARDDDRRRAERVRDDLDEGPAHVQAFRLAAAEQQGRRGAAGERDDTEHDHQPGFTAGGLIRRRTPSTRMNAPTAKSSSALPVAARISARA